MTILELIEKLKILSTIKKGKLIICYYDPFFDELVEIENVLRIKATDNTKNKEVVVLTNQKFEFSDFKLIKKKKHEKD